MYGICGYHVRYLWRWNRQALLYTKGIVPTQLPKYSNVSPIHSRTWVFYTDDWLSIKFCENGSFRKLFLFFENNFQYLRGSSQEIPVSHFDSRRSLSSANRRRSTFPIIFVSFTQLCVISMTGRPEFCVRVCCMFLKAEWRGDWDVGLCTTSGLVFGEPLRSGDFRKNKRVLTQEKSDFAIALRFYKSKSWSCAQTYISVSSTFWY